jgi:hypothetical protein
VGSVFETDSYQDGKVADVFLIRHSPTGTSSKSIFDFGNFVLVRAPLYDYFRTSPPRGICEKPAQPIIDCLGFCLRH